MVSCHVACLKVERVGSAACERCTLNPVSKQTCRSQVGALEWLKPLLLCDCLLSDNQCAKTSASSFVLGWSRALTGVEGVYVGVVPCKISLF